MYFYQKYKVKFTYNISSFEDKILVRLEQCSISERDLLYRILDYALQ